MMRSNGFRVTMRSYAGASKPPKAKVLRHPVEWKKEGYYDESNIEEEMRRVLDVCHGCRRCFSLCDSFPILFDKIDASPTEELDSVPSADFKKVSDACTLCDMCYTAKCPYVPPHEFAIDLPHLVLRYRAWEQEDENKISAISMGGVEPGAVKEHHKPVPPMHVEKGVSRKLVKEPSSVVRRTYANQDLMGPVSTRLAPLVNIVTGREQRLARTALEAVTGLDRHAPLPRYESKTFGHSFVPEEMTNAEQQRKVVLYSGCFVNNNRPSVGEAIVRLLRASNVHVEVCYPECCGMPQLEQGLVGKVAEKALRVVPQLKTYVDRGFDVISLTPSCTFMLKQEWPLLNEGNKDVQLVADKTFEASEYLLMLSKNGELCGGKTPEPMNGAVTVHHACHARAQNIGWKSKELLGLVPKLKLSAVERCSGHGGVWGFEKANYERAHKIGKPVVDRALKDAAAAEVHFVTSDCPMAVDHLLDGMERQDPSTSSLRMHPMEILSKAFHLS